MFESSAAKKRYEKDEPLCGQPITGFNSQDSLHVCQGGDVFTPCLLVGLFICQKAYAKSARWIQCDLVGG